MVDFLKTSPSHADPARAFRRTLAAYFAHVFSYDFIFGYAIFPAYFQLQGSSPELIGALLAFWAAGIILFEIPSGLISDSVDRRILLVLAPVCKGVCFVIWVFADGREVLYFAGMAFWSLASALRSGTKEALLYEHVAGAGKLASYTSILGKERAFQDGATLLGAATGGLIAGINLELAFWLSLLPLSFCALSVAGLANNPTVRSRTDPASSLPWAPFTLLKSAWNDYFRTPGIRYVIVYVMVCVTFLSTLEDFNQLFLLEVGLPVWAVGLVVAAMGTARTLLAAFAGRLEGVRAISWLLPLACGLALLVSGTLPSLLPLVALACAYILTAPLLVLSMSRFQKVLSGASRATSTSVLSVCIESLSVLFNLSIALLLSLLTVLETYQVCGLYLTGFALFDFIKSARNSGTFEQG